MSGGARGAGRRLALGLATLMGLKRGYFIPHRHAAPAPSIPYGALEARLGARSGLFREALARLAEFAPALEAIGCEPAPAPRWAQDWFPRLDAAMAYGMVRCHRPRRIVEVGGGHSTRFLARAIQDGGLECQLTVIDPAPRASLAGLPSLTLARTIVQAADPAIFEALRPGDMLLIDSSHVLMPGSDVDLLLNRVLPRLPGGILVHVHDIFLPDGYPAEWAWRGYNEQTGIAILLASGGAEPLFASHYALTRMGDQVAASAVGRLPLMPGAKESGLWLRWQGDPP
jgi:predicted O-methyltransferase YrrM